MADQTKYSKKLQNSRILIIGGTSGIGYGVAEDCLEQGAIVTISSSRMSSISSAISSLEASYPSAKSRISGHTCNLADPATMESNIASLFEKTGEVDHVVYTAGDALGNMPIESWSLPQIQAAGMVRFFGPLLVAKYVARYVPKSPRSSYTITTGSVSEKPLAGWSLAGSYAGGHHTMARGLALDLKPIRINAVSPGPVATGMWRVEGEEKEKLFKSFAEGTTTGEVSQVQDVVEAYMYVLRDNNVTGSVISTNGGALIA